MDDKLVVKSSKVIVYSLSVIAFIAISARILNANERGGSFDHINTRAQPSATVSDFASSMSSIAKQMAQAVHESVHISSSPESPSQANVSESKSQISNRFPPSTDIDDEKTSLPVTEKVNIQNEPAGKLDSTYSIAYVASKFESEESGFTWEIDAENEILDLFGSQDVLSGFLLNGVDCRASGCKLSFGVTDAHQFEGLISSLTQVMYDRNEQFTMVMSPSFEDDKAFVYFLN